MDSYDNAKHLDALIFRAFRKCNNDDRGPKPDHSRRGDWPPAMDLAFRYGAPHFAARGQGGLLQIGHRVDGFKTLPNFEMQEGRI